MGAPLGNKNGLGNHDTGRPSKFKASFVEEITKFFDLEPFRQEVMEWEKQYYKDGTLKKESSKSKYIPNRLPTLYRFAKSIGVKYSTVWRWAEKGEWDGEDTKGKLTKPDEKFIAFCNAYKEAKELQKEFLMSIGLSGAAPSAAYIFTAKNVTDMKDKQEIDHTSKGEKIFDEKQSGRIARRVLARNKSSAEESD